MDTHTRRQRTLRRKASDWGSIMSPASTLKQIPGTADDDDCDGLAMAWSTMGMSSLDQYPPPWEAALKMADAEFMFSDNLTFDASASSVSAPYLYTPAVGPYSQSPLSTISNDFDASPMAVPEFPGSIDTGDALSELCKMNLDLHTRVAAAETYKANLQFDDVIYRQGVLYIDDLTLAEFMLKTSQSFLRLLTKLDRSRQPAGPQNASPTTEASSPSTQRPQSHPPPPPCGTDTTRPLAAVIALAITSVFTQLLSLYELMLHHFTARVEWSSVDPMAPIPGIVFGVSLDNPCARGILFSINVLERIECTLGISSWPGSNKAVLLSARQLEVLWSELDGRNTLVPGRAVMRPATMRRLFGKVAAGFRKISADSLQV